MPELVLLTHATEFDRPTNTGRLVQAAADVLAPDANDWQVRTVLWQRKVPDAILLQRLTDAGPQPYVLLYPSPQACLIDVDCPSAPRGNEMPAGFILLDATWQQAQKMYNQSPYLHPLVKWQLQSGQPSQYLLRRNQRQQGWCTAELVSMLWRHLGASAAAGQLAQDFQAFNRRQIHSAL